ncbi:MAG: rhomboid family intramembrane serine protease, partial [Flavobacteriales bacterium]
MNAPIVSILIGANVLLSFIAFEREQLFKKLQFSPMAVLQRKEWERVIGHAFIHGGILHLAVNMLVLYMFGGKGSREFPAVEPFFQQQFDAGGTPLFLTLYFGGVIVASIPALFKHGNDPHYRAVGAS